MPIMDAADVRGGEEKMEGIEEVKDGIEKLKGDWEAIPARMSSMLGRPCLFSRESVDTTKAGVGSCDGRE
jgi:hypothetical protein